jgi:hypothetical protein
VGVGRDDGDVVLVGVLDLVGPKILQPQALGDLGLAAEDGRIGSVGALVVVVGVVDGDDVATAGERTLPPLDLRAQRD